MSVYDFYNSDPRLFNSYLKAFNNSWEKKQQSIDTVAWLVGNYVKEALKHTEAWKVGKSHSYKYPTEPASLKKDKESKRTIDDVTKNYLMFKEWADSFNKKRRG